MAAEVIMAEEEEEEEEEVAEEILEEGRPDMEFLEGRPEFGSWKRTRLASLN